MNPNSYPIIDKPIIDDKPWWSNYSVISDKHPKQKEIFDDKHQFKCVSAGSGFGKTLLAIELLLRHSIYPQAQEAISMIVMPSYDNVIDIYWNPVINRIKFIDRYNELKYGTTNKIFLDADERRKKIWINNKKGGITTISFKSGEAESGLLSVSVNGILVIDEMWKIKSKIWYQYLLPRIMRGNGKVFIISTPNGHDHFWDIWCYGSITEGGLKYNPKWKSWRCNTYDNSMYPKEYCESFKSLMTKWEWNQQFEGRFDEPKGKVYIDFNHQLNVKPKIELNLEMPVYMTWDFNVDPMTTTICQLYSGNKEYRDLADKKIKIMRLFKKNKQLTTEEKIEFDSITESIKNYSDIKEQRKVIYGIKTFYETGGTTSKKQAIKIKQWLNELGFTGNIFLYGDATGGARQQATDKTNWSNILYVFDDFKVYKEYGKSNPDPVDRIDSVNTMLLNADNEVGIYLDEENCKPLITDFQQVNRKKNSNEVDKVSLEAKGLNHCIEGFGYMVHKIKSYYKEHSFLMRQL